MHFVLVHGAGHGAWCWYKVRAILEAAGHTVTCLDLKSAGIDPTDPNTISSFDEYDQPLHDFLSNLPDNEKVSLVGHSQSGANVTNAIFTFPEKIHVAIYLAANMMRHVYGKANEEVDAKIVCYAIYTYTYTQIYTYILLILVVILEQKESFNLGNKYEFHFSPESNSIIPTSIRVKEDRRRHFLYNMSPEEDYVLATMLLKWSPVRVAKISNGEDVVPRVYIKTLKDHMAEPSLQDLFIAIWPPSQVYEIESDHSAFFSQPDQLSALLIKAANSISA
ncbi:Chain A family protein [Tripterygium wilfordii]|uniref:Chain A family protein n=1 Tax=Tripterygium wilfordii TaxID=458696 RepID=A0A7J7DYG6_TRIWF|nr:Chain A family protein [Tripterygium wilfordii]